MMGLEITSQGHTNGGTMAQTTRSGSAGYQHVPTATTTTAAAPQQTASPYTFTRPLSSTLLRFGSATPVGSHQPPVKTSLFSVASNPATDFLASQPLQQQFGNSGYHGSAAPVRAQGGHRMTMPTSTTHQPVIARYAQAPPSRGSYVPVRAVVPQTATSNPQASAYSFLASGSAMLGGPTLLQPHTYHGQPVGADGTIGSANARRASMQGKSMPFGGQTRQQGW